MPANIVTPVELFLLAVSLGLFVMAVLTITHRRQAPQSRLLALAMCAEALYCLGYSQEMAQTTLAGAIFWLRVEYIGIPWIPALWVLIGRRHFGLRGRAVFLSIIPVIVAIAEWTNGMHGLYDRSMMLVPRGPFWMVEVHRGPIAWLNLAFLYGSLFYGTVLCLSRIRGASGLARLQSIFFALSCVPPLIGYLIYFFGWSPWGLDLAPLSLCFTVVLVYVAVFRLEWFHLVPTVRSLVFKSIRDSVLAIDLRHRLVDFNPAASVLFPWLSEPCLGRELSSIFPENSGFLKAFSTSESVRELSLRVNGEEQHFEMRVFPLNRGTQHLGWAVIVSDITAQIELVQQLHHHAVTDSLTEIANRRAFDAALEREFVRASRYRSQFAVLLIDVDHFKMINDVAGHAVGDRVLQLVARHIAHGLRSTDLPGRYGGDEFAILLPDTALHEAWQLANRIRDDVGLAAVDLGKQEMRVTLSVGLTVYMPDDPADPTELLEQADQALYSAKSDGRNRVGVWRSLSTHKNTPLQNR
jgi:diguanylate cyclase (GGDEF)-like protein/PAS domain S-box-containing protein